MYSLCLAFFFFYQHYVSTLWESPTPWVYHIHWVRVPHFLIHLPSVMIRVVSSLGLLWLVLQWTFLSIFVVSTDTPISARTIPRSRVAGSWMGTCSAYLDAAKYMFRVSVAHYPSTSHTWAFQWLCLLANIGWHLFSWTVFILAMLVCVEGTTLILLAFHCWLTKNTENFQTLLTTERSSFMKCLLKSLPTYLRCCCVLFSKCQLFVGKKNTENIFSNCVAFIDSSFFLIFNCENVQIKKAWKSSTVITHISTTWILKLTSNILALSYLCPPIDPSKHLFFWCISK